MRRGRGRCYARAVVRLPRPGRWLNQPLSLPQVLRSRADPHAPRIFSFNDERGEVEVEVTRRAVEALRGRGASLEVLLNETALDEIARLERQRDDERDEHLDAWMRLSRRLAKMSPDEQVAALEDVVRRWASDVTGNFDPRVYAFTRRFLPPFVAATMKPHMLLEGLANPTGALARVVGLHGSLEHVHRLVRHATVIFVPTHVSNFDSIAVGELLAREDLPPVTYGAGKNLFSNPIISFFMHNLGAYRIDRRIRARVYKQVLKTYSTVVLERGYHMLFFPGGTRCRSGLVEASLKLGLAGTAIEAYTRNLQRGVDRPIVFVPVTINYALVLEAESLIADYLKEQGQARYIIEDDEFSQIERWWRFFRQLSGQDGACLLRFGRAMDPFGNFVDDFGRSLAPDGRTVDPSSYVRVRGEPVVDARRDAGYIRETGRRLAAEYRRETVVMSTQLLAHVVYRRLVQGTKELDLFARMRKRGEVVFRHDELLATVEATRDRLRDAERRGELHMSDFTREQPAERILERTLAAWSYHTKPILDLRDGDVVAEDPTMLLYYQNRLAGVAEALAGDEDELAAARIIASLEGTA